VSHHGVTPVSGHGLSQPTPEPVSHFGCDPMVGHGLSRTGRRGNVKIFAITFALLSYVAFLP